MSRKLFLTCLVSIPILLSAQQSGRLAGDAFLEIATPWYFEQVTLAHSEYFDYQAEDFDGLNEAFQFEFQAYNYNWRSANRGSYPEVEKGERHPYAKMSAFNNRYGQYYRHSRKSPY